MGIRRTFGCMFMMLLILAGSRMVISWAQSPYPQPEHVQFSRPNVIQLESDQRSAAVDHAAPANPYQPVPVGAGYPGSKSIGGVTSTPVTYTALTQPKSNWGAQQAAGPPDTPNAGDYPTAWASRQPDGPSDEWLSVTYDPPVEPIAVLIYENCNPGAIATVQLYDEQKRLLTKLEQPVGPVQASKRNLVLPIGSQLDGKVSRIDIVISSQRVPGWNEIDAIGLIDAQGQTHWANSASASSSFGDYTATIGFVADASGYEGRIQRLEQEVSELRGLVRQLQQRLTPGIRPAIGPGMEINVPAPAKTSPVPTQFPGLGGQPELPPIPRGTTVPAPNAELPGTEMPKGSVTPAPVPPANPSPPSAPVAPTAPPAPNGPAAPTAPQPPSDTSPDSPTTTEGTTTPGTSTESPR